MRRRREGIMAIMVRVRIEEIRDLGGDVAQMVPRFGVFGWEGIDCMTCFSV